MTFFIPCVTGAKLRYEFCETAINSDNISFGTQSTDRRLVVIGPAVLQTGGCRIENVRATEVVRSVSGGQGWAIYIAEVPTKTHGKITFDGFTFKTYASVYAIYDILDDGGVSDTDNDTNYPPGGTVAVSAGGVVIAGLKVIRNEKQGTSNKITWSGGLTADGQLDQSRLTSNGFFRPYMTTTTASKEYEDETSATSAVRFQGAGTQLFVAASFAAFL